MYIASTATYANECSKPTGLLQHLSFCRKRNRENIINSNAAINDSNNPAATSGKSDNYNYIGNGDYETYIWKDVPRDNIDDEITVVTKSNLSLYLPRISINKTHTNPEDHLWGNISFDSLLLTLTKYTKRLLGTTKICSKFLQDSVENSLLTN